MSSTASAAAAATGLPPKVEAWAETVKTSASFALETSAPIGRPPASAFAQVKRSGFTS